MRRNLYLLSIVLAAASCTKELPITSESGLRDISLCPEVEVKSTFTDGDDGIVWTEGDRLSVLDGTANRKFITNTNAEYALFIGKVDAGATDLAVVYPYDSEVALGSGSSLNVNLPSSQWAVEGKVSDEAMLAVGRTSVSNPFVTMKNVVGFISMELSTGFEKVTKIDFSANGGEILAGSLAVSYDGGSDPAVTAASGSASISACTPYDSLTAGRYFLCARPVTLASGFTLTFHRADGKVASIGSSKANTIRRNKLLDLGTINAADLEWSSEPAVLTDSLEISFATWPFDNFNATSKFPDTDRRYVHPDNGCAFDFTGEGYQKSGSFTITSLRSSISLPAVPGYRLSAVRHTSESESGKFYFTDIKGMPVSARDFDETSASTLYRLNGLGVSESAVLMTTSATTISKLTLIYESVASSPAVKTVGAFNGSTGSFTFEGGAASQFDCGIEYIPSGKDEWSDAVPVSGTITSSTSSSAEFSVSVPSGAYRIRPWARPKTCSKGANRYGAVYFTPSAHIVLEIDFNGSSRFTKVGTEKGGSGSSEDPRYGYDYPTGKQVVINQETGETSNDGSSVWGTYRDFTGYLSNYPVTKFNYSQDGGTYTFILGTGQSSYNAFMYWSSADNCMYSNKALFKIPGVEGYTLRKIVFNMTAAGEYQWRYGIGSNSSNIGYSPETVKNTYKDIEFGFPKNIDSGINAYMSSTNSYYIKKMTIEYVKD